MAKKLEKKAQRIVYRGSKIDYAWDVAEYGSDEKGNFAILNVVRELTAEEFPVYAVEITSSTITVSTHKPDVAETAEKLIEKVGKKLVASAEIIPSKKSNEPITKEVQVSLSVHLNDDERNLAAQNASLAFKRLNEAKDAEKLRASREKAFIKSVESEVSKLIDEHNTGLGQRLVHCVQEFDLTNETTWYRYRGQRYELREMSDLERREVRNRGLFNDAPMLPDQSEQQAKTKTKKSKKEIPGDFSEPKKLEAVATDRDQEIRDVMKSEKKKGGKHDHVST